MTDPTFKKTLQKLPVSWEAERSYLSCVLQDNGLLGQEPVPEVEDFYFTSHQRLYKILLDFWEERRPCDWVILADHLKSKDPRLLSDFHGPEGLEDLSLASITLANAPHYARILREKRNSRRMALLGADLEKSGLEEDFERAAIILERIEKPWVEKEVRWLDASDICRDPVEPIEWLAHGLFPRNGAGTVDGPPDSGKSTLVTSLAVHIANGGGSWFGQETIGGPVVVLGGEKSSRKAWRRDFERLGKVTRPGMFLIPELRDPLWEWNKQTGKWIRTKAWSKALRGIRKIKPGLVVGDTIMRITAGIEEINNTQQAYFGKELEEFAEEANCLFLVIGHTNQASTRESLSWRLHYTARSGGNGLPGVLRFCFAVTRLYGNDTKDTGIGEDDLKYRRFLACGVSKGNELPFRAWSDSNPAFFEIRPDGQLMMLDKDKFTSDKPMVVDRAGRLKYPENGGRYEDPFEDL